MVYKKYYSFVHLLQAEITVIIANLKIQAKYGGQLGEILLILAEQLHQTYGKHE